MFYDLLNLMELYNFPPELLNYSLEHNRYAGCVTFVYTHTKVTDKESDLVLYGLYSEYI